MKYVSFLFLLLYFNCTDKTPLETVLSSESEKVKSVLDNIEKYEIQILFTEITEKKDTILFKDYEFQVNDSTYFYPASSVKFPIAILALEKMRLNTQVNRNTLFSVKGDSIKTTFANDINDIFAVSDNFAYTRLFEYLGQDYITKQLKSKGIISRISHRFSGNDPYSLTTKPLYFYEEDNIIFQSQPTINNSIEHLELNNITKGIGFIKADSLVRNPMDFSLKNYIPLQSLHNMMKQLIYPELFPKEKRFNLSESDRIFLLNAMKLLPKEAGYTSDDYYDSYVKILIFGDSKKDIPEHITIYNKVGFAYGYLTDCAYIVNNKTNKKYIITATIHVNENQIYNDGIYEYEAVGIPFLAELGRQLIKF